MSKEDSLDESEPAKGYWITTRADGGRFATQVASDDVIALPSVVVCTATDPQTQQVTITLLFNVQSTKSANILALDIPTPLRLTPTQANVMGAAIVWWQLMCSHLRMKIMVMAAAALG